MTRTLDILDRLIAFPTVSSASNLALIDWVHELLARAGLAVTRIPSPCGDKAGLHARIGPDLPGGICLSGHTDVVPTAGQNWTCEPFWLSRDEIRVRGRGTTDMKGFVASALAAAERAAHADLKEPLSLVLSYDEEIGCVGIRDMLPALAPLVGQPRLVLVGEPTSMQIGIGHKGKVALRVICTGEAGHSALAPQFINAIHVACAFVNEIRTLQDRLADGPGNQAFDIPYSTVHVGRIEGGRALNIVPDAVTLDMEIRHIPESPEDGLLDEIDRAVRRIDTHFGRVGLITVETVNRYPGLMPAPPDAEVMAVARHLVPDAPTTHLAFGTEAGYFAQIGLNAVVIGPGDMASDGHKPDESLSLRQIDACDAMMDRVLDFLSRATA